MDSQRTFACQPGLTIQKGAKKERISTTCPEAFNGPEKRSIAARPSLGGRGPCAPRVVRLEACLHGPAYRRMPGLFVSQVSAGILKQRDRPAGGTLGRACAVGPVRSVYGF